MYRRKDLTFQKSKELAERKGGRLPEYKEMYEQMDGLPFYHGEVWAAVYNNHERDWINVGDKKVSACKEEEKNCDKFAKSGELYSKLGKGYPVWGDDPNLSPELKISFCYTRNDETLNEQLGRNFKQTKGNCVLAKDGKPPASRFKFGSKHNKFVCMDICIRDSTCHYFQFDEKKNGRQCYTFSKDEKLTGDEDPKAPEVKCYQRINSKED